MAVARHQLHVEGRRIAAFARRNPLTIAGALVGVLLAGYVLHSLEGQITHVERQQTVVERNVVRISTCAAKPHSKDCLRNITRAVKRCLEDPACNNLIAGAEIVAVRPRHPDRPRTSPNRAAPAASPATEDHGGGHGGGHSLPPPATPEPHNPHGGGESSPSPTGHPPGHPPAPQPAPPSASPESAPQTPQDGAGAPASTPGAAHAAEPPANGSSGRSEAPQAAVEACVAPLGCVGLQAGLTP